MLNQKTEYTGKETITVGDGTQLEISHIGNNFLPSLDNQKLKLNNILHVPTITKNLLSVSKLTNDNDAYMEFHSDFCVVKDKTTGRVLHQGKLKKGPYQLESRNKSPNLFLCQKNPSFVLKASFKDNRGIWKNSQKCDRIYDKTKMKCDRISG